MAIAHTASPTEQVIVRNRWTNAVQFTATIEVTPDMSARIKLGLAVKWARKNGAKLREADLRDADLSDADLSDAYLRGADLRDADLSDADLRGADLSGADLRDAPIITDIHAKVYAAATARPELFDMRIFATGSGHTCGTAQCRAGWVLAVSGQEGLDLEAKIGTPAAAMAIYMASDPERWETERLPNFFTDNATALADMARMAGVSA